MQANIFVTVSKTALNSENTICYPEIKDVHVGGGLEVEHEPGKRSCSCGGGLNPKDIYGMSHLNNLSQRVPWLCFDA